MIRNAKTVSRFAALSGLAIAVLAPIQIAHAKSSYAVLHSFSGGTNDGGYPAAGFIPDNAGNLYSTSEYGGANGLGTVFEFSPTDNTVTILYSFAGGTSSGEVPDGNLYRDSSGNLYGTTNFGGSGPCTFESLSGCGTVFELMSNGMEQVLYAFQGGSDGIGPEAGLIADNAGNLYGMAYSGGSSNCTGGCGIAFEISPSGGAWTETIIHSFGGGNDGSGPLGNFVMDSAGNLYGTTSQGGGSINCSDGCGAVFELSPSGNGAWTETLLYAFKGGRRDGALTQTTLLADSAGNYYGTTSSGGRSKACTGGCGTVFKLSPSNDGSWTESLLYSFKGGSRGALPLGDLIADAAGNLYGTAAGGFPGGPNEGCGTVFMLAPSGREKTLHSFTNNPDGCWAVGDLFADSLGDLYGTTASGGAFEDGTVYKLKEE